MLLDAIDCKQYDLLAGSILVYDGITVISKLCLLHTNVVVTIALLKRFAGGESSSKQLMTPDFARQWDKYLEQIRHHHIDTSKVT
jgi:hypothetical protein